MQPINDATGTDDARQIIARRRGWLSLMADADDDQLTSLYEAIAPVPEYRLVRPAQVGLAMVRARMDARGASFNLGEMTLTRCTVRLHCGTLGHAYVAGRKPRKAERIAVMDALLTRAPNDQLLYERLIRPLELARRQRCQDQARRSAATRVDFYTLVRGED